jgi:hypothetical protein
MMKQRFFVRRIVLNVGLHRQATRLDRLLQGVRYRSAKGDVNRGLKIVVYIRAGYNNSALNI